MLSLCAVCLASMAQASAGTSPASRRPSRRLPLASTVAAVLLIICLPAAASAATRTRAFEDGSSSGAESNPCTTTAETVARTAQRICGGALIEEALLAVRLRPEAADETARLLAAMGFAATVELEMLPAGTPEMDEVMDELKSAGLSVGDRSKVRLLVGDRGLQARGRSATPHALEGGSAAAVAAAADGRDGFADSLPQTQSRRRLQENDGGGGLSMDTVAIVLTVLVGAAG